MTNGRYSGALRRVVDGDTLDLLVALGLGVTRLERCRLLDVDVPERFTPPGQAAIEALRRYLPEGTPLHVLTRADRRDKYGRLLIETYRADTPASSVSDWLVAAGHAQRRSPAMITTLIADAEKEDES